MLAVPWEVETISASHTIAIYWSFDAGEKDHVTHVQAVLTVFRDGQMKADIDHREFYKPSWEEAGFKVQAVGRTTKKAFMIIPREHIAPKIS